MCKKIATRLTRHSYLFTNGNKSEIRGKCMWSASGVPDVCLFSFILYFFLHYWSLLSDSIKKKRSLHLHSYFSTFKVSGFFSVFILIYCLRELTNPGYEFDCLQILGTNLITHESVDLGPLTLLAEKSLLKLTCSTQVSVLSNNVKCSA